MSDKSRRDFIKNSLAAGVGLPLLSPALHQLTRKKEYPTEKPVHPLRILILGGTSFLGPHQIAYALGRGHSISIFTRGKTNPTIHKKLFREVEQLVGDREDNLEALKGRQWDAVIDNSGRRSKWTRDTALLLKDHVELYLYTSSTGVFYPYLRDDIPENEPLVLKVPENINEDQALEYGYGVMKSNSELEAKKGFGEDRCIIVRPTYMLGPADQFDRFVYWPVRLEKGGEVMIPGRSEDPVQFIDVRDVAAFMIRLLEQKKVGTYNTAGPASPMTMPVFIHGAHAAFSSPVNFTQIDDFEFLKNQGIPYLVPWIMPEGDNYGSARINNQKAISSGLTFTPLAKTIWDVFEWWHSDAVTEDRRNNLWTGEKSILAKEPAVLKAWKNK